MILRRIRIEGYKALRNPVDLSDMGPGLHLIHGPNETGKSTLMSAVARALFDRYNTQDQEIKALRPWGTELAPRVLLEFDTGGKRLRLEKRFLDEESSALSEWNGTRFERVADSVKADDQVRSYLLGTAAKSGATSLGNWGLARLLWMTQLPSRVSPPELDESLRQRLLGVLGSTVLGEKEQEILGRLDKAYDVYYTAAKQSERKGSPLAEARERLKSADDQLALWKAKWADVSRLNETALEARSRLSKLEGERKEMDLQISALRARAEAELELENLIKLKDQQNLVVLSRWKTLNLASTEISELERATSGHRATIERLEPGMAQAQGILTQAEERLARAGHASATASDAAGAVARELASAGALSELRALFHQMQVLRGAQESATELERARQAKVNEYTSRKRPKESDLEDARALKAELDQLAARISDQGIKVRFTPEREGIQIEWQTADGKTAGGAGECVFRSADQGELTIPGVGRIRISSGAEDSKNLRIRLDAARERFAAKLAAFGVDSLEDLSTLRQQTAELEFAGQAARSALNSALGSKFKSVAEMSLELERLRSALQARCATAGIDELRLESLEIPDSKILQEKLAATRLAQDVATRERMAAEDELRALRKDQESARLAIASARQSLELLSAQLTSKLGAVGGRETLERELGDALIDKTALEKERELLAAKLPPFAERASGRIMTLETARESRARLEESARKECDQSSALLMAAEGEGYYSKLASAEEERAMAAEVVAQRESRARGTRVLRTLAHAKRDRLNSNLMAPIESSVSEIFNTLRGPLAGGGSRLSFGSELHEMSVMSTAGNEAGLESLSLGTQDQAMLALRLAFGQMLSERGENPEPQLIVLDDPLVNADPERQARALELLKKASAKMQILILTARPEDYRILAPKEYDLANPKLT
jgi:DNA repair exonuclease SbcCD ATPase subunit